MRDRGSEAVCNSSERIFHPLILLFAVSITGLMLTASYTWMKGTLRLPGDPARGMRDLHPPLAPIREVFHIFQRPALGVCVLQGRRVDRRAGVVLQMR